MKTEFLEMQSEVAVFPAHPSQRSECFTPCLRNSQSPESFLPASFLVLRHLYVGTQTDEWVK